MMDSKLTRPVFFFDIDNCVRSTDDNRSRLTTNAFVALPTEYVQYLLAQEYVDNYCAGKKVHDLMQDLINDYFVKHLSLSADDASMLHQKYYKDYGLAVSGLALHHKIDPLEFNREVDDALPLDGIITPNPQLRQLLSDFDRSKVKMWLFTNAYITHARRVIRLLGVEDMFEGITYCDYGQIPLHPKPHVEMYEKAETEAGATSAEECFFVGMHTQTSMSIPLLYRDQADRTHSDDSHLNCVHAHQRGWTTVHLLEDEDPDPEVKAAKYQIRDLEELRILFPQFFKTSGDNTTQAEQRAVPSQL